MVSLRSTPVLQYRIYCSSLIALLQGRAKARIIQKWEGGTGIFMDIKVLPALPTGLSHDHTFCQ